MASSAHGVDRAGSHTEHAVFCPAGLLECRSLVPCDARYSVGGDMASHRQPSAPASDLQGIRLRQKTPAPARTKVELGMFSGCVHPVKVFH
jgi:hypothetical protein